MYAERSLRIPTPGNARSKPAPSSLNIGSDAAVHQPVLRLRQSPFPRASSFGETPQHLIMNATLPCQQNCTVQLSGDDRAAIRLCLSSCQLVRKGLRAHLYSSFTAAFYLSYLLFETEARLCDPRSAQRKPAAYQACPRPHLCIQIVAVFQLYEGTSQRRTGQASN